jgi:hypothetical protein
MRPKKLPSALGSTWLHGLMLMACMTRIIPAEKDTADSRHEDLELAGKCVHPYQKTVVNLEDLQIPYSHQKLCFQ